MLNLVRTTRTTALEALQSARVRALALTDFDDLELTRQHSPLMSPLVWDLAHIGQQEEYFLLQRLAWKASADPIFRPEVASLYDAFTHSRASRVTLPLLDAAASRRHLEQVRLRVLDLLSGSDPLADDPSATGGPFVTALVAQHELQHVETMLATHQLRDGVPLLSGGPLPAGRTVRGGLTDSVMIAAGPAVIGADPVDSASSLDNERPQHTVQLPAFRLGRVPVTAGEWLDFIRDGGYAEPRWWSPEGWAHRTRKQLVAPLFWARDGAGGWLCRRFGVMAPVALDEPVQHVDYYEAEAFARWADARLPTELEWEKAAAGALPGNLGGAALRPAPVGAYPEAASRYGVEQLLGDVWEWTSSPLTPWPGFAPMIYDNYSAPFFGPDYRVLRGGSWATDAFAVRTTFRNWDLPIRRQIFSGVRLAWDA